MKYLGQTCVGLIFLFLALPTLAAESRHQFYADSGFNYIDNSNSTESAWTTTLGYSYFLSPFVGVDFGYTDTMNDGATFYDKNGDSQQVKYRSFFAGATIEQPINSFTSVYARGGVGQTNIEETNTSVVPETSQDHSGINPYIGIGAKIQPMYVEKLELSVELKYQDLQNEYSATSFTLGAKFSL
ncbi:outer membrane beta-barrel protein [Vibrio plantisponsor]|jgi:opacity protein-like surface antigen|uniref:Outer membrane beta-barrel protein n=1 Tax=Vibrio plantisponsor TaxID=664643 RepID=A0ABU4IR28_9VIBR|nr:outer membrane beta-barrel protein [Vibrio plantisponsor]MDW6019905.1 outer membrane beta-barrel protein [Vibrio plantisponsor]NNM38766.1 porin family protein [Vibrio plantisponsor]PNH87581.1 porin family protein [Vibrio diazotrophicus]